MNSIYDDLKYEEEDKEMLAQELKQSFSFDFSLCKVWAHGECFENHITKGSIIGNYTNGQLDVAFQNFSLPEYVKSSFSFKIFSLGAYYHLWVADEMQAFVEQKRFNEPMFLGLYFIDGELALVNLNMYEENVLIEFFTQDAIERIDAKFDVDLKSMKEW